MDGKLKTRSVVFMRNLVNMLYVWFPAELSLFQMYYERRSTLYSKESFVFRSS